MQDPLPFWIAVGGTPQSVVRAGSLGIPMALAIIGGEPARFKPLIDLYREAARRAGHDPAKLPVSINSHGFIADPTDAAAELAFPAYADAMGGSARSAAGALRGPSSMHHGRATARTSSAIRRW